jgi:hypothetical protein
MALLNGLDLHSTDLEMDKPQKNSAENLCVIRINNGQAAADLVLERDPSGETVVYAVRRSGHYVHERLHASGKLVHELYDDPRPCSPNTSASSRCSAADSGFSQPLILRNLAYQMLVNPLFVSQLLKPNTACTSHA